MNLDRNQLKTLITKAKSSELLVLNVNRIDKNSSTNCYKEIDKFIKSKDDCVVIVIKR